MIPFIRLSPEHSERGVPSTMIDPLCNEARPVRSAAIVDLPLPLSPTIPTKLFLGICILILCRTSRSPS